MPGEAQVEARDDAEERMLRQTEHMVTQLEQAAESTGAPPPHEAGNAAIVEAIGALARLQGETGAFVQQTNALIQQNLNEFSKALSNTDISAQRAAAAAEATAEMLEPEEASAPDTTEQPSQVEELPESDIEANKSKAWWFGKAAYRHGKARA